MKILVVGSGGREHAIIRALKKSPKAETIYALPGNGGIAADAICVEGSATDMARVVSFSKAHGIAFVVVAPDNPLVLGMVDALNEAGIATFGPRANAAILEGSKSIRLCGAAHVGMLMSAATRQDCTQHKNGRQNSKQSGTGHHPKAKLPKHFSHNPASCHYRVQTSAPHAAEVVQGVVKNGCFSRLFNANHLCMQRYKNLFTNRTSI